MYLFLVDVGDDDQDTNISNAGEDDYDALEETHRDGNFFYYNNIIVI